MEIIKGGKYRHYKGNECIVLDIAYHSETEEKWLYTKHSMEKKKCG